MKFIILDFHLFGFQESPLNLLTHVDEHLYI